MGSVAMRNGPLMRLRAMRDRYATGSVVLVMVGPFTVINMDRQDT